jgi:ATP-binding cassette, subfamily C (CFTR/MRP), member 1
MAAVMRLVDLSEGQIKIDEEDISSLGLAKLRSKIAVIPQDPVLFSGTIRSNLDPFDFFRDNELLAALEKVGLTSGISNVSNLSLGSMSRSHKYIASLCDPISEGGSNFSVGQRQLLVIARALLQGAKIVIMDEATAAIDPETDAAIQKVMRFAFSESTCLTIAHRINTVFNSDYVLVMSDGQAVEFDTPDKLMQKGGLFRDLVEASKTS